MFSLEPSNRIDPVTIPIDGIQLGKDAGARAVQAWRNTRDFSIREQRGDFVNLTVGDPIFPPHAIAAKALRTIAERLACADLETSTPNADRIYLHQYRWPKIIHPELEAAARSEYRKTGIPMDLPGTEIIVGVGVSQLTSALFKTLERANKNILLMMPTYGLHLLYSEFSEVQMRAIPTSHQDGMSIDATSIKNALLAYPDTDVLYLINPNNPTGQVWSPQETREIGQVIVDQAKNNPGFIAVVDEIYSDIILSPTAELTSLASLNIDGTALHNLVITMRGVAKGQGGASLRIGIATAGGNLLSKINMDSPIWRTTLAPSDLDQLVAAALWRDTPAEYYQRSNEAYRVNRDLVIAAIEDTNLKINQIRGTSDQNYVTVNCPDSGFFMVLTNHFLVNNNSLADDFALMNLLVGEGLGVLPGSSHGFNPKEMRLRLSLSVPQEILMKGMAKYQATMLSMAY